MSRASVLARGRSVADDGMFTTCEIQFVTGSTTDPATDADVPAYETAFTTQCRVKSPGRQVNESQAGGRTAAETVRELHIPVGSVDPWADPLSSGGVFALFTSVHATDDPSLEGVRVRLSGPAPGSQTTARRLQITEVVS